MEGKDICLCSKCLHSGVCKYMDEYNKAKDEVLKVMSERKDDPKFFRVKIMCDNYWSEELLGKMLAVSIGGRDDRSR